MARRAGSRAKETELIARPLPQIPEVDQTSTYIAAQHGTQSRHPIASSGSARDRFRFRDFASARFRWVPPTAAADNWRLAAEASDYRLRGRPCVQRGTGSSIPFPSSGESCANLISRLARLGDGDRLRGAIVHDPAVDRDPQGAGRHPPLVGADRRVCRRPDHHPSRRRDADLRRDVRASQRGPNLDRGNSDPPHEHDGVNRDADGALPAC
jgi:hypothetical protein